MHTPFSTITAALLLATSALVADAKTPPCPAGRYLLSPSDQGLVFADPATDAVTLGAGTLAVPPCGSTKAKVKTTKSGLTKVSARWATCGTAKGVVIAASIGNQCAAMTGSIKAKKVAKRSFTATVSTGCGDGLLDAGLGEDCETAGDCAAGDACTACACVPVTTTTTTVAGSTTTTTLPDVCGDGVVTGTEECDPSSPSPPPGCTTSCTICGNNIVTAPETCDDGNLVSGDGCDANCTVTACGNGVVAGAETCDDGNTDNNDDCPANCIEAACTPDTNVTQLVEIHWAAPSSVAGITVLVDYPESQVDLPGTGGNILAGTLTGFPSGTSEQHNDLGNQGHALREVVTKATAITPRPGTLFKIDFNGCQGTALPTATDFTCTVLQAFAPDGITPVAATCSVVIP